MANTSVSGLVSGLDTATIISQLMQIEAQPQTNLKSRVSDFQKQVTSLQTVNSKLQSIAGKAAELAKLSSWSPSKATTDNTAVTVTAGSGAVPASLSLTVVQRATSYSMDYGLHATTDMVTSNGSNTVMLSLHGGTAVSINTGDGSVQGLVNALNSSNNGVTASLVKVDATHYRLSVSATATGGASDFTLTDSAGNALAISGTATAGQDAKITVGPDTITSASNTFTDLMPGVAVTLGSGAVGGATPTTATITVSRDPQSLSDKVKSMVDAVNATLDDIDSLTAYKTDASAAGILSGDATLRDVRDQLLSSVTSGVDGQSLASVGIQTDKTGHLVFDAGKFTDAYNADPTGTAAKFAGTATYSGTGTVELNSATWRTQPGSYAVDATAGTIDGMAATVTGSILVGASGSRVDGLSLTTSAGASGTVTYHQGIAAKLEALAQRASDATVGSVTTTINGRKSSIDDMNDRISDWDVRLQTKQESLQRQYAALEVALGKLQDQASWLSGQISSLPKMGG